MPRTRRSSASTLVELLTEEGFEVVGQAADGEEAVKLARELEPDLIIMDVKMPGMDGITAAEIIGEERIAPSSCSPLSVRANWLSGRVTPV